MELAPLLVFFRYDDVPGVIGRVGTLFGEAGVNIANMAVSRTRQGGKALMALSIDSPAPPELVERLRAGGFDDVASCCGSATSSRSPRGSSWRTTVWPRGALIFSTTVEAAVALDDAFAPSSSSCPGRTRKRVGSARTSSYCVERRLDALGARRGRGTRRRTSRLVDAEARCARRRDALVHVCGTATRVRRDPGLSLGHVRLPTAPDERVSQAAARVRFRAWSRDWPEPVERVAAFLRAAGAEARVEEFRGGTPTARDAADAVGCELAQIVKSLLFALRRARGARARPGRPARRPREDRRARRAPERRRSRRRRRSSARPASSRAPSRRSRCAHVERVLDRAAPARPRRRLGRRRLDEPHGRARTRRPRRGWRARSRWTSSRTRGITSTSRRRHGGERDAARPRRSG